MHSTSEGYRIITDLRHGRFSPGERDRLIVNTAKRDGKRCMVRTEEEGGSSGKSVTFHYAKLLVGYNYKGIRPGRDKWSRAQSLAGYAENGLVIVLAAGWNLKFFDELEQFPHGKHDDIVDAASGAHNELERLDRTFMDQVINASNTDEVVDFGASTDIIGGIVQGGFDIEGDY